ncbi:MAG: GNAT family N-acetyltransferase [Candidatus Heimdallarchaeaceae archaeon]|jgi:GNAT superfamily N-acetyltransferase
MSKDFDMNEIEITEFNPVKFSREEWQQYHDYRRIRHKETSPDDPLTPDEIVEKGLQMQMDHPEMVPYMYTIQDTSTNKRIGTFAFMVIRETSASYEGNKHLMQYDIALLPEYRRKGIGTRALKMLHEFAIKNEKSIVISGSEERDGKAFLKAIGAQTVLSGVENRLNYADVDWNMIEEWEKEGPNRSPETKLEFFYSIPDEIIEPYSKVYTETLNQQPLGDLDVKDIIYTPESLREMEKRRKELGRTHLTYITVEPNGEISGLTEMLYRPERENMIVQLLTGVKQDHRGRGLGKWLKAVMMLRIRKEFPSVSIITTDNATTNAPMLSINDRLGFKVHKESITGQMKTEDLGKYLEGK